MTTGILEFNDLGLRYYNAETLLAESPGYAYIEKNTLLFGDSAKAQAKLHPAKINHQFWQQLSLTPVATPTKTIRHNADLAYQHIRSLLAEHTTDTNTLLAVPGSFSKAQLGLLLGVVQSLEIPIQGIIDNALLACQHLSTSGTYVHIDLQLHQTVISEIIIGDGINRENVEILGATGLVNFSDAWAQGITDQFIQQTRFNPLHGAESEQQLHNQLFDWLHQGTAKNSDGSLRIQLGNREITLLTTPVLDKTEALYRRIIERVQQRFGNTAHIVLSDRLASLPNATSRFADIAPITTLNAKQVVDNLPMTLPALSEHSAQTFITQVAKSSKPQAESIANRKAPVASGAIQATHLLKDHQAFRLSAPLVVDAHGNINADTNSSQKQTGLNNTLLQIEARDNQTIINPVLGNSIYLNQQPLLKPQPVYAGDVITLTEHPDIKLCFITETYTRE